MSIAAAATIDTCERKLAKPIAFLREIDAPHVPRSLAQTTSS
jgi:hypothetical protein